MSHEHTLPHTPMRTVATDDKVLKMTKKDWQTLEEVARLEQMLLSMRGLKLKKEEKKEVTKHAKLYGRILRDPKSARVIAHCFGDEAVLASMRAFHNEVMKKLAA